MKQIQARRFHYGWMGVTLGTLLGTAALQAQPAPGGGDESHWIQNVRQVTREDMGLARAGEAYFSPDGKRICFQAHPRGKDAYQIYVMDLDGAAPQMISNGEGHTTCSYFHPDGTRLIYASNHLDPRPPQVPEALQKTIQTAQQRNYVWPFPPGMDIFEYDFTTKATRRLTATEGYDAECSYSPDGRRIIFTALRDRDQDIYICDADGRNARPVVRAKGYDGGAFFSPDGQRILYRSDRRGDGTMQVFVNNLEGTAERALTDHDVLNWCPFWHPSGKWVIFTRASHRGKPNYDLYLVRDDGAQMLRVTTDAAFDGLPAFSPDGRKLLWTSKRGGLAAPQVFVADFIGLTPAGELRGPAAAEAGPRGGQQPVP